MTRTPDTFTARMTRVAATAAPPATTSVRHAVALRAQLARLEATNVTTAAIKSGLRKMDPCSPTSTADSP
jgi:hypothetical protein